MNLFVSLLFVVGSVIHLTCAQNFAIHQQLSSSPPANTRHGIVQQGRGAQPSHQQQFRDSVAQAVRDLSKSRGRPNAIVQNAPVQITLTTPTPPSIRNQINTAADIPVENIAVEFSLPPVTQSPAAIAQATRQAFREQNIRQHLTGDAQAQAVQLVATEPKQQQPAAPQVNSIVTTTTTTEQSAPPSAPLPLPLSRHSPRVASSQSSTTAATTTTANKLTSVEENDIEDAEQALDAHYSFGSSIQDTINDHSHTRQETRDGLSLTGMYSYSDGFFRRTVHYAADEGGYRVTKEEIEPIGDGPIFNSNGRADVSSSLSGSYSITTDDFKRKPENETLTAQKV